MYVCRQIAMQPRTYVHVYCNTVSIYVCSYCTVSRAILQLEYSYNITIYTVAIYTTCTIIQFLFTIQHKTLVAHDFGEITLLKRLKGKTLANLYSKCSIALYCIDNVWISRKTVVNSLTIAKICQCFPRQRFALLVYSS